MGYRDERRADQAAERAQQREDRRLELEAQRAAEAQRAEQKRLDAAAAGEARQREREARRRQEAADKRARQQGRARRRAERRVRVGRVMGWLNANPATLFVGYVMAASVIPAVISQVGALAGAGVTGLLAVLLATMLEGGAWALVFMGRQAEAAGRQTWKYRLAGWATAAAAAGVNFWHWAGAGPLWVAAVFAGSSLFAFFLWDVKTHGSQGMTRAERREAAARRRHARARRRHHRGVAREADRLMSAMPYGSVTESEAFAAAWRIQFGTEPGMTPETYSRITAAGVELEAAFRIAEEERPTTLRAGLLAGALSPLPRAAGGALPTLGPVASLSTLTKITEVPTAQAGIGSYGPEGRSRRAPERAAAAAPGRAAGGAGKGAVQAPDRDLERLMPKARIAAAELVAEGLQISATSLAKRLQIRRQDAIRLRDMVVAERKEQATANLRLVAGEVAS
jgi:hypothetical protein